MADLRLDCPSRNFFFGPSSSFPELFFECPAVSARQSKGRVTQPALWRRGPASSFVPFPRRKVFPYNWAASAPPPVTLTIDLHVKLELLLGPCSSCSLSPPFEEVTLVLMRRIVSFTSSHAVSVPSPLILHLFFHLFHPPFTSNPILLFQAFRSLASLLHFR